MSKRDIDLGLAVLSTDDFIERAKRHFPHDWQTRIQRYDVAAAACGCSTQHSHQECERALQKVRDGLRARGIGLSEGLMILEALTKERLSNSSREPLDRPVYNG